MSTAVKGDKIANEEKGKNVLEVVKPTLKEEKTTIKALMETFKPTPLTAEARIQRVKQFDAVSKRFNLLNEKANDLKMFDAGNDKIDTKIILKNGAGFAFEVSNSFVIKKVRDVMEQELNILLREAENEVVTFEM